MPAQFGNLPPSMGGYASGFGTTNFNAPKSTDTGQINPPYGTGLPDPTALPDKAISDPGAGKTGADWVNAELGGFQAYGASPSGGAGGLQYAGQWNPQTKSWDTMYGDPSKNSFTNGTIPQADWGAAGFDPNSETGAASPGLGIGLGFADGGVIGGGDYAGGGSIVDPQAATGVVQKALAYGRSLFKLPAQMFGSSVPDTQSLPTEGESSPINSLDQTPDAYGNKGGGAQQAPTNDGEDQTASYADGGVIEDDQQMPAQPTDNQQVGSGAGAVPSGLQAYAMGAGAMPADLAAALEQRVDPQGQMDPAMRKLLTIANTGDPKKAFSLMQHYRQRYQVLNAYAQAAAEGSPQRPANIAEATQAATRAYHNVPTGQSVRFQPAGNGVRVHIAQLGQAQQDQQQDQQQGLASGGTVVDDQAAITDNPDSEAIPGAGVISDALPQGDPNDIPADTGGLPGSSSLTGGGDQSDTPVKDFIVSVPDFVKYFLSTPWDKHVEQGVQAPAGGKSVSPSHEGVIQGTDMPAVQEPAALDTSDDESAPGGKSDDADHISAGYRYKKIGVPDSREPNSLGGETYTFTVPSEDGSGPTSVGVTYGPHLLRNVPIKYAVQMLATQGRLQNQQLGFQNALLREREIEDHKDRRADEGNETKTNIAKIRVGGQQFDASLNNVGALSRGLIQANPGKYKDNPQLAEQDATRAILDAQKGLGGGAPQVGATPQPQQPGSPPASALKEGVITNFANGQSWTLKNGQPQRVR